MFGPLLQSLFTVCAFLSVAFAHYLPTDGTHSTWTDHEHHVVIVTEVISSTVTTCVTTSSSTHSISYSSASSVGSSSVIVSTGPISSSYSASTGPSSSQSSVYSPPPSSTVSSATSGSSNSISSSPTYSISSGTTSSPSHSSTLSSSQTGISSSVSVSSQSSTIVSSTVSSSSSASTVQSKSSTLSASSSSSVSSQKSTASQSSSSVSSSTVSSTSSIQSSSSSIASSVSSKSSSSSTSFVNSQSTSSTKSSSSSTVKPTSSTTTSSTISSTKSSSSSTVKSTSSTTSSTISSTKSSSSSTVKSTSSTTTSSTTSSTKSSSSSTVKSTSSTTTSSTTSSSTSKTSTSSSTVKSTSSTKISSTTSSSTSKTSTSSSSTATATACSYWLENIKHQGVAPFSGNSSYQVFRNVKTYGAKGDGKTDDTAAINKAISDGSNCPPGGACASTTTTPALIYFPAGTYIVSAPIVDYYYTSLIGNPNCMPVIKATNAFTSSDAWVIDGDKYGANGLGYGATNVFWRQIRNFIIDMTSVDSTASVFALHWPTAQATSVQNVVFKMSDAPGTQHQGILSESGSGGFMTDLTFYGGLNGLNIDNQQFAIRNLTFYNAVNAINHGFDWGWVYKGISIYNCSVGLNIATLSVASLTLIDSVIKDTPIGISADRDTTSATPAAGSLILENVQLINVPTAVQGTKGSLLAGTTGTTTIAAWGQGNSYTPTGHTTFQGPITPNTRPGVLTSGVDYYERSKPQYENYPASSFVSVRDFNAKGDGTTDDTVALTTAINSAVASGKILYFDAGDYLVSSTLYIPPGSKITGEAYPVILASGSNFANINSPTPVVQIGKPGDKGTVQWSDLIISTKGAQAGAILIEWNLDATGETPAGMWDVHTRIGGFTGSDLQVANCPTGPFDSRTQNTTVTAANLPKQCIAAFLSMHVTESATGLYMENVWLWVADHDADDAAVTQISVYAGRGLLVESTAGAIWMYGTAVEHHSLYQYQFANTKDIFLGQIQTETPYYQPNPNTAIPFSAVPTLYDPAPAASALGLRVLGSSDILIYSAGLYSFFYNYNVHCSDQGNGEWCQPRIFSVESSSISLYNLNTVGTQNMIAVDGTDIASYTDNIAGFIDTIALFRN